MSWLAQAPALAALDRDARAQLEQLIPMQLSPGDILFHPGDAIKGYAIVLSGQIDVTLSGVTGREILLYSVVPGQSCIQSTMGLLGGSDYTAEAVVQRATTLVLLPKNGFLSLVDKSAEFRAIVFNAFADRMQDMMQLLEKLAFQRAECRIAEHLLRVSSNGTITVRTTQADLAMQVGTAREVVSRRLEIWSRRGWVRTARGTIEIRDADALRDLSLSAM